jgi:hypothetical protein
LIGVGVDFKGHVWGVSKAASRAGRLDVDAHGERVSGTPEMTHPDRQVEVGQGPYTYSDFTGYGLKNFTTPQGRYQFEHPGCAPGVETTWRRLAWSATLPARLDWHRSGPEAVKASEIDPLRMARRAVARRAIFSGECQFTASGEI